MRKVFEGPFRIAKHRRHPVVVSGLADTIVPVPIVGMNLGPFGDGILDEADQTLARSIGDVTQANPARFLTILESKGFSRTQVE